MTNKEPDYRDVQKIVHEINHPDGIPLGEGCEILNEKGETGKILGSLGTGAEEGTFGVQLLFKKHLDKDGRIIMFPILTIEGEEWESEFFKNYEIIGTHLSLQDMLRAIVKNILKKTWIGTEESLLEIAFSDLMQTGFNINNSPQSQSPEVYNELLKILK